MNLLTPDPPVQPDASAPAPLLLVLRALLIGLALYFYAQLEFLRYFPPVAFYIQATILTLLLLWGVWKLARRERLVRSPLAFPLVVLLGATTLSTLFSIDPRHSFNGLLITLAMVLFFFLFCDMLLAGWSPHTLISALLWLATLAIGVGVHKGFAYYWQELQSHTGTYPLVLLNYRLSDVTDHPNFLAAMLNLALPFAIVRLARARQWWGRAGWALWLLAYEIVLVLTRSRGGWVAASAAVTLTVIWLLLSSGRGHRVGGISWLRRTWPVWSTTLLYGAVFLLLVRGPDLWTSLTTRPENTAADSVAFSELSTNSAESVVTTLQSHRMILWEIAWKQFLEHPLWGEGPLSFPYAYVDTMWTIRFWVPMHAHNLFFEILGTQGAAGVLAFAWVVLTGFVLFVRGLWSGVRGQGTGDRGQGTRSLNADLLLCVCAALASFFVHSLVDVIGRLPSNILMLIMLVVIGLQASGALWQDKRKMSRWTMGVLVVVPVLVVVLVRQGMGLDALHRAMENALGNNWAAAASAMDEAVAADPQNIFYYGQRGYAYSVLAAPAVGPGDPLARTRAIQSYERSLQFAPPYTPDLLNMAALLEQAGRQQQARQVLEHVVALPQSRYWALPHLLLADYEVRAGNMETARQHFAEAFRNESYAPEMAACQRSAACREAAATADPRPVYKMHYAVQDLLEQGEPQQALDLLEAIPPTSSEPLPWLDRANAHLALGQISRARYALHMADTLRRLHISPFIATQAALSHAALLLAMEKEEQAIPMLEGAAFSHAVGSSYSYGVFQHLDLPGKFQPRLELLQRTEADLAVYRLLVQLYAEQGEQEGAVWAQTRADALAMLLEADKP
jgi:O-antigen ligase